MNSPLFDPAFFRRLEKLRLLARRVTRSERQGERRSRAHGTSLEFADFREYLPGDDFRFVDWNAFARLERLFIKLFHEEASLRLTILVDNSPSMDYGSSSKFDAARRLCAAFAYLTLARLDQVEVRVLGGDPAPRLTPRRGRGQIFSIIDFLTAAKPAKMENFSRALRRAAPNPARNAFALVLSDFLDPAGYEDGVRWLRFQRYQVGLVQMLAPEEIRPDFAGDRLLEDPETGAVVDVTASPRLFRKYQDVLAAHSRGIEDLARRTGSAYAAVDSSAAIEEIFHGSLRRGRFVSAT